MGNENNFDQAAREHLEKLCQTQRETIDSLTLENDALRDLIQALGIDTNITLKQPTVKSDTTH